MGNLGYEPPFGAASTPDASTPDASATTKGKVQLAGDLGGSATAPTVPGLAVRLSRTGGVNETVDGAKDALGNWHFTRKPWADPQSSSYGAIGDGTLHTLAERYGSLGTAQAKYPFATALTNSIDRCALQLAANTNPAMVRSDAAAYVFADGEGVSVLDNLDFEGRGPFLTSFETKDGYAFFAPASGSSDRVRLRNLSGTLRPGGATGGLVKCRTGGGHGGWRLANLHVDGDGRRYVDGTANGTTTFTTATSFFTPADAGKLIAGQYIVPGTTIAAYVSATQVTLSQAASGSASGLHGMVEGSPDPLLWVDGFITSYMDGITTQSCGIGVKVAGDTFASNSSSITEVRAVIVARTGLYISGNQLQVLGGDFEVCYGNAVRLNNASSSVVERVWFEENLDTHLLIEDSINAEWRTCRFQGNVAGAPAGRKHAKVTASSPTATKGVRGLGSTYNDSTPSGYDVEIGANCKDTVVDGGRPHVLDGGTGSQGRWGDPAGENDTQHWAIDPVRSRTEFRPSSETGDSSDAASAHVLMSDPTGDDYVAFHRKGHMEIRTASGDPGPDLLQVYSVTYYVKPSDGGLYARIRNISGEHTVRLDTLGSENTWSSPQHFADNVIVEYNRNLYFKTAPGAGNAGCAILATPFSVTLTEESSGSVAFKFDNDGIRFFDSTGARVGRRTLGAAATDAASTQTLANNIRQALIDLGLGQT